MSKRNAVKFEYDRESDAAYLKIRRGKVVESEEVEPGLIVDLGADDEIVGVEILRFSRRFSGKAARKLAS
jgi:uncharacterized protein YuzE